MRSKWVLVLAFGVSLLLAGCGKANPMVGTWKFVANGSAKETMPVVTAEFRSDDTYSLTDESMGQNYAIEGAYKLKGNTLSLTLTKSNGKPQLPSTPLTITLAGDGKSFELPGIPGQGKMVKQ